MLQEDARDGRVVAGVSRGRDLVELARRLDGGMASAELAGVTTASAVAAAAAWTGQSGSAAARALAATLARVATAAEALGRARLAVLAAADAATHTPPAAWPLEGLGPSWLDQR